MIPGSYNPFLVLASVCIAVLASYTALDLAARVTAARGRFVPAWLAGGSTAMGIGIWSMHYTGMAAFSLPIPVMYHWPTALLALLVGMVASAAALFVLRQGSKPIWCWAAGIFQGGAIASLHYTAMASMRMRAMCHYSPLIVTLSVLVAIAGSVLSLWLMLPFRDQPAGRMLRKVASSFLMGAAISSMHYTGMAAASFTASGSPPNLSHTVEVSPLAIAAITVVPVMVLLATWVTALLDRLQEQKVLLDELFEEAPHGGLLMDQERLVVRVNREFTRLFGYTPREAVGRHVAELIVPEESLAEFERYAGLTSQGQRVDTETIRRHKDGSRLNVFVATVPVRTRGGQIATYAMYLDITVRKKAEAALRTLSSRLLAVQETERRRLGRELHDDIGQVLTGLRWLLHPKLAPRADGVETRLEEARALVDDLLGKVRSLSFALRPADLDQLGLVPALLALFERFTEQTGVLVDFKHDAMGGRLASDLETGAYRIVQEALTNVARHAGVAAASVRVWIHDDMLNVQIEDRGHGFDPDAILAASGTIGLSDMRERAMLLGGRLTIESSPGSGTTITAELPARQPEKGRGSAEWPSPLF